MRRQRSQALVAWMQVGKGLSCGHSHRCTPEMFTCRPPVSVFCDPGCDHSCGTGIFPPITVPSRHFPIMKQSF